MRYHLVEYPWDIFPGYLDNPWLWSKIQICFLLRSQQHSLFVREVWIRSEVYRIRSQVYRIRTQVYRIQTQVYRILTQVYLIRTEVDCIRTEDYRIRTEVHRIRTEVYRIQTKVNRIKTKGYRNPDPTIFCLSVFDPILKVRFLFLA